MSADFFSPPLFNVHVQHCSSRQSSFTRKQTTKASQQLNSVSLPSCVHHTWVSWGRGHGKCLTSGFLSAVEFDESQTTLFINQTRFVMYLHWKLTKPDTEWPHAGFVGFSCCHLVTQSRGSAGRRGSSCHPAFIHFSDFFFLFPP